MTETTARTTISHPSSMGAYRRFLEAKRRFPEFSRFEFRKRRDGQGYNAFPIRSRTTAEERERRIAELERSLRAS